MRSTGSSFGNSRFPIGSRRTDRFDPGRLTCRDDWLRTTIRSSSPWVSDSPWFALDAATGETRRTYRDTNGTEEIIAVDDKLFLVAGDPEKQREADLAVRRGNPVPRGQQTGDRRR